MNIGLAYIGEAPKGGCLQKHPPVGAEPIFCRPQAQKKEGESMSFEDIQKVAATEQDAQAKKAQAQAEAKQLVSQAHRDGAAAVEKAKADAEAQVKAWLDQAGAQSAKYAQKARQEAEDACQAMRAKARGRLDKAAELIVRRVVDI